MPVRRIAATTRSKNVCALFAVLLVACLLGAGCGSGHLSIDKKNAQQVAAAWLGESDSSPKVSCRGHVCEIGIRHSFVDISEAWLIIVPVTLYYKGRDTQGVNRIVLRVTDERRGQMAVFRCSLRKSPPDTENWLRTTNVRDARKMCKGSVAPTSDS